MFGRAGPIDASVAGALNKYIEAVRKHSESDQLNGEADKHVEPIQKAAAELVQQLKDTHKLS